MIDLIDSHCHLEQYFQAGILEDVLKEAQGMGVGRMIAVGTHFLDWKIYCEIAGRFKGQIYYSVGIHPSDVDEHWESQAQVIASFFAEEFRPVAIGEIGLDYYHLPEGKEEREVVIRRQKEAFCMQLSLALQFDCPIIIHSRNAFEDCVKMIDESGVDWKKVVFHCFVEGPEQVRVLNDRGGRASFTGIVTYKNAESVRQAILAQGIERLMIETDAPFLAPVPYRGKENRPGYVRIVAEYCAGLFGMELEEFAGRVTKNTEDFFGI